MCLQRADNFSATCPSRFLFTFRLNSTEIVYEFVLVTSIVQETCKVLLHPLTSKISLQIQNKRGTTPTAKNFFIDRTEPVVRLRHPMTCPSKTDILQSHSSCRHTLYKNAFKNQYHDDDDNQCPTWCPQRQQPFKSQPALLGSEDD